MKYLDIYNEGAEKLKAAGVNEAALDARLLLEFVCDTDHNTLLVHGDMEVEDEKKERYFECIDKRSERIPVAYITNSCEFMGLDFYVTGDVLIPNQDTETLTEEALRYIHDGMRIMDLCTGSGCIGLSLLRYSNDTHVVATDISDAALEVAKRNADNLGVSDRFMPVKTDIFPEKEDEKFDIIVSNPPYIRTSVIDTLEPEVKKYEPYIALDGSEDGLVFYKKIVPGARDYLYKSGYLFLEIGYDQGEDVRKLMEDNGYKDVQIIKDLGGNDRVVLGCYY
ncbi:peptide chain release factor N(5)-glutamine methyltransferase [Butyrivibrio sp. NC2002]|uniref:peptide chain release factor N(5)-glutamine methyltransferase n=1 Tax=Butyrivibrio sp. NC2002 TaxID=1410610 RepID=UPI00055D4980|nr:peptide chain release factor N(5)-glutamine methyltransferase [Butyrivibrio sp. NC2002]